LRAGRPDRSVLEVLVEMVLVDGRVFEVAYVRVRVRVMRWSDPRIERRFRGAH
jgi:hypothetical protein